MFLPLSNAETGYEVGTFDSVHIFEDFDSSESCNCVAFRLDDIQGYWLNEVQLTIIETFHEEKVPLTIGIIGAEKYQFGVDPKITNAIKEKINAENSLIEIANHGWEHEFFPSLDTKTQSDLIKKTNSRIFELLGVYPKVFIPPFNEFNNDTITALEENGISHFSSMLELSTPPFPFQNMTIYNFPETATTGKFNDELGIFEKVDRVETFENINKSLESFGYAVVTMHPQEFAILENGSYTNHPNFDNIRELELLIEDIQNSGLKIVFLSQINKNVLENNITIPKWFQNVYSWWAEEKISSEDLVKAIKFLQEHNIMDVKKPQCTK